MYLLHAVHSTSSHHKKPIKIFFKNYFLLTRAAVLDSPAKTTELGKVDLTALSRRGCFGSPSHPKSILETFGCLLIAYH